MPFSAPGRVTERSTRKVMTTSKQPIMILVMRSTPLCNPMEQTMNPAMTVTAIQPT